MSSSGRIELLKKNQTQRPEQRLDVFTKIKFKNRLPDIPMEPKFFQNPLVKLSRFAEYKPTKIEQDYRFELTMERDLDLNVDLNLPEKYVNRSEFQGESYGGEALVMDPADQFAEYKPTKIEQDYRFELTMERDLDLNVDLNLPEKYVNRSEFQGESYGGEALVMDPADQYLVEDETKQVTEKRRANHNEVVSWMRKTQYLGSENARYGSGADRQETKVGYKLFKEGITDQLYRDRQGQIAAINKTFEDVKIPCKKHPTKEGVYAVEEFEVFPDFDSWQLPYAQVLFDGDPIPSNKNKDELMDESILVGVNVDGEDIVGYYVPTEETLAYLSKLHNGEEVPDPEKVMEYNCQREYNWTIKTEGHRGYEPIYFFTFKNGKAYYNQIGTKVKLARKAKGSKMVPPKMHLHNDEVNEAEKKDFENRLTKLAEPEIIYEDEAEKQPDETENQEKPEETENQEKESKKLTEKDIFGDDTSEGSESSTDSDDSESVQEEKKKTSSSSSSSVESD
uniref:RNA polymerase II-associated factor 1 homolog n=2 Tax=Panagrolaimus sp. JU765 TaxID=591449 RepID=A0AC34PWX4_9BILA